MAGFRNGSFQVLVATDVAARGLDISDVQLVIQVRPQTFISELDGPGYEERKEKIQGLDTHPGLRASCLLHASKVSNGVGTNYLVKQRYSTAVRNSHM